MLNVIKRDEGWWNNVWTVSTILTSKRRARFEQSSGIALVSSFHALSRPLQEFFFLLYCNKSSHVERSINSPWRFACVSHHEWTVTQFSNELRMKPKRERRSPPSRMNLIYIFLIELSNCLKILLHQYVVHFYFESTITFINYHIL